MAQWLNAVMRCKSAACVWRVTECLRGQVTGQMVSDKDEAALRYLVDVREEKLGPKSGNASAAAEEEGFRLLFEFRQGNPFFSDTLLTKTYRMDDNGELMVDRTLGCDIHWASEMDLTGALCPPCCALAQLFCAFVTFVRSLVRTRFVCAFATPQASVRCTMLIITV